MARSYGKLWTSIWSDVDFTTLNRDLQHAYMVLVAQPRLSMVGLLDYMPNRLARCSANWTVDDVETDMKGLEEHNFIVIDRDTNELLIRSFIRSDKILMSPNLVKGAMSEYAEVMSETLRKTIDSELRRAFQEDSGMIGWKVLKEANPILFRNITANGSEGV
jgi:hypothetical protein